MVYTIQMRHKMSKALICSESTICTTRLLNILWRHSMVCSGLCRPFGKLWPIFFKIVFYLVNIKCPDLLLREMYSFEIVYSSKEILLRVSEKLFSQAWIHGYVIKISDFITFRHFRFLLAFFDRQISFINLFFWKIYWITFSLGLFSADIFSFFGFPIISFLSRWQRCASDLWGLALVREHLSKNNIFRQKDTKSSKRLACMCVFVRIN